MKSEHEKINVMIFNKFCKEFKILGIKLEKWVDTPDVHPTSIYMSTCFLHQFQYHTPLLLLADWLRQLKSFSVPAKRIDSSDLD